jgi:hypothetical protein
MPDIPDDWPIWATLLFLILTTFKGTLIKFLPAAWRSRQEHGQEIEEIQLNARLQTQASEQLRKSWREEMLLETIQNQQAFVQDVLTQEIKAQNEVIGSLRNEIRSLRRAVLRVGDITAAVFSSLRDTNGEHLFKMSGEIDDIIGGPGEPE